MGITGLLPFLKKGSEQVHIKQFKGFTIGVDAYCWLHKGAIACADKLAKGEETDAYVYYCMKYVNMLLTYGVKPVMVFDGCRLPAKESTEKSRRNRRKTQKHLGKQLLRDGRTAEAFECFKQCIDITPNMAHKLMIACRQRGVDYVVAPYEADAQLAYLNKRGIIQLVVTEDSDLLLFGCDMVIFKMDLGGHGILIRQEKLSASMGMSQEHFTFDKFRHMCILSGCDYLPSLPGIGLARSCKVFQRVRSDDLHFVLRKLPQFLNASNLDVPLEYIEGFVRANNVFLHQVVFDPLQRKQVPLNEMSEELSVADVHYAGSYVPDNAKAYQLALGNIDYSTMKYVDEFDPTDPEMLSVVISAVAGRGSAVSGHQHSIWSHSYRSRGRYTHIAREELLAMEQHQQPQPQHQRRQVTATLTIQGEESRSHQPLCTDSVLAALQLPVPVATTPRMAAAANTEVASGNKDVARTGRDSILPKNLKPPRGLADHHQAFTSISATAAHRSDTGGMRRETVVSRFFMKQSNSENDSKTVKALDDDTLKVVDNSMDKLSELAAELYNESAAEAAAAGSGSNAERVDVSVAGCESRGAGSELEEERLLRSYSVTTSPQAQAQPRSVFSKVDERYAETMRKVPPRKRPNVFATHATTREEVESRAVNIGLPHLDTLLTSEQSKGVPAHANIVLERPCIRGTASNAVTPVTPRGGDAPVSVVHTPSQRGSRSTPVSGKRRPQQPASGGISKYFLQGGSSAAGRSVTLHTTPGALSQFKSVTTRHAAASESTGRKRKALPGDTDDEQENSKLRYTLWGRCSDSTSSSPTSSQESPTRSKVLALIN